MRKPMGVAGFFKGMKKKIGRSWSMGLIAPRSANIDERECNCESRVELKAWRYEKAFAFCILYSTERSA